MKKYALLLAITGLIAACGGGESKSGSEAPAADAATAAPAAPAAGDLSSNPDYVKGLELIGKSDCLTCHKVKEKLIGPAYQDVANKYENNDENIKLLAGKIIQGGKGVWGEVPMTPHPQISEEDAKQMVKYVLLLKK
ncbi:MAG: c-type cytochrome [Sediminibacterium sp.]|nr:c-type cytochrome [Sediminibacterium sp.]